MNFSELQNQFLRATKTKNNILKIAIGALFLKQVLNALFVLVQGSGLFYSAFNAFLAIWVLSGMLGKLGLAVLAYGFFTIYRKRNVSLHLAAAIALGISVFTFQFVAAIGIILFSVSVLKDAEAEQQKNAKLLLILAGVSILFEPLTLSFLRIGLLSNITWVCVMALLAIVVVSEDERELAYQEDERYNSNGYDVHTDVSDNDAPVSDEVANAIAAASPKTMYRSTLDGDDSQSYKTVAAPAAISITKDEDYEKGVVAYANILNRESVGGWEFSHIQQIPIVQQAGCLARLMGKENTLTYFNMLVFKKTK